MTKEQIKAVLDRVLTWPHQQQEDAAQLLLDIERSDKPVRLTDEQVAEVKRRMAEPDPKFLTLEEVRSRFALRRA
jgi:transposase